MVSKLQVVGWGHVAEHHFGSVPFPLQYKQCTARTLVSLLSGFSGNPRRISPSLPRHFVQGERGGLRCFVPLGHRATRNSSTAKLYFMPVRPDEDFEPHGRKSPASKDADYNIQD